MSILKFMVCDVCGSRIEAEEEFKTAILAPRESPYTQRTVHICEDCYKRIGFNATPTVTLTGGKIGRVDK